MEKDVGFMRCYLNHVYFHFTASKLCNESRKYSTVVTEFCILSSGKYVMIVKHCVYPFLIQEVGNMVAAFEILGGERE